ncbi:hypothetical protein GCM10023205_81860 [Yinghuangia aomiensis]|uniref:Transposase IS4-like domain-containing protein n=1 Tax=Yinghuangia aomiensis TaxID=676205 RepID=A0ABP9IG90_9ACTN
MSTAGVDRGRPQPRLLRDRTRRTHGRAAGPSAAVMGAQSVKTSCNVAETDQGIDVAKKIKGRKRHIVTDTLGLLLAVLVTAASVHDSVGGKHVSVRPQPRAHVHSQHQAPVRGPRQPHQRVRATRQARMQFTPEVRQFRERVPALSRARHTRFRGLRPDPPCLLGRSTGSGEGRPRHRN